MKKIFWIRVILIIMILINCITIFKFSNEQAEKSSSTSGKVIDRIIEINPKTKELNMNEKNIIKEKIVTPVRKTGHFTIYFILGILLFCFTKTFNIKDQKRILISLFSAFVYACTDEIHQLFVNGRSGELRDVCIDSVGALFGIFFTLLIFAGILKLKVKTDKQ